FNTAWDCQIFTTTILPMINSIGVMHDAPDSLWVWLHYYLLVFWGSWKHRASSSLILLRPPQNLPRHGRDVLRHRAEVTDLVHHLAVTTGNLTHDHPAKERDSEKNDEGYVDIQCNQYAEVVVWHGVLPSVVP